MYVAQPIEWTEHGVVMLDQRRLPAEEISHTYTDYVGVAKAIREMVIRGAPAIGVAAAMGVAIGVQKKKATDEAIGRFGAEYMPKEGQVMTQCNAGALAIAGIGSALGVIRMAYEQGRKIHVLVPE